jgi:uncharacterized protein YodC (DUF2158 family)
MDFKRGDTVKHKSGTGPQMAVVNVWTEENPPMTHAVLKLNGYGLGDIQCEWFIGLDKE